MELAPQQVRVLGCLVEKQLTTPQQYPLTLNALTMACNQTSNREPVVTYDEQSVEEAVTSAKTIGLARFVHPSHGRSAVRYAHTLEESLGVDRRQLALLAVLMLRGAQTPGELRARTERMENFDDLSDLERELERLAQLEEPLVVKLPRRPGQKEVRFAHLLAGVDSAHEPTVDGSRGTPEAHTYVPVASTPARAAADPSYESLERAVAELREQLGTLRADLDELRAQLGA